MNFKLSLFNRIADNKPKPATRTWQELCERFANPVVRAEKDGPLFSGASYEKKTTRAKVNVVELSVLGLDCDHNVTLDGDLPHWRNLGVAFAAYTTHSHRRKTESNPEAEDRFRLVFPLSQPIPRIYYRLLWDWANALSGEKLDKACKDPSRMLYIPVKASEDAEYYYEIHDGPFLDWGELPPLKYAVSAFESEINTLLNTRDGSKHDQLYKSSAALGNLVASGCLDGDCVKSALEDAARKIGYTDEQEIARMIGDGLSAGYKTPRGPDSLANNQHKRQSQRPDTSTDDEPDGIDEDEVEGNKRGPSKAALAIALAEDAKLFHNAEGKTFATVRVNGHVENWPLRSSSFKKWLAARFWQTYKTSIHPPAIAEALLILDGRATYEGEKREVYTRLAEYDGAIYLDLCDDTWRVVEITSTQRHVITATECPARFRRSNGMLALPEPQAGGNLDTLRGLLNLGKEYIQQWILICAWLVAALRPRGPYPILSIHGEQGSGKSTVCRMLRALVDPNTAPLRSPPKDERDLMIAANNSWVLAFDNLATIPEWLSNALCRVATGGGFAARELYTNDEEAIFDTQRPMIINGITEVATKPDLLDRSMLIYLPVIPKQQRRDEETIWREFANAKPFILGCLLDAVSVALRELPKVTLEELPRMADFAKWGKAAEQGLGIDKDKFIEAYTGNRSGANDLVIEGSPVAAEICEMLQDEKGWEGQSKDLLADLNRRLEARNEDPRKKEGWPRAGRGLTDKLKVFAPNLRAAGFDVQITRTNSKRKIIITRVNEGNLSVTSVTASNGQSNQQVADDTAKSASDAVTHDGKISDEDYPYVNGREQKPYDAVTQVTDEIHTFTNGIDGQRCRACGSSLNISGDCATCAEELAF